MSFSLRPPPGLSFPAPEPMPFILIVCTANICRSPVVAALLRQKLDRLGYKTWRVGSAGTLGVEGWPPAEESAALMAIRGLDITDGLSVAVTADLLDESDLVLCMEESHADTLRHMNPKATERIRRLAEMAGEPRDIADPYGGTLREFEAMVNEVDELLDRALDSILEWLT